MMDIIQNLYELMVQVYNYDSNNGRPSRDILSDQMYVPHCSYMSSYYLHDANREMIHKGIQIFHASAQGLNVRIPPEVIQYVDEGRNPDSTCAFIILCSCI